MRIKLTAGVMALALAASSVIAIGPAAAQYRHHHGGGGGAIAGFAAGAILGGVLASQPYGGYYGPGYYGPGPGYYGPGPGYYAGGGDAVGYCMSRFKSYDPGSGTYMGYDGHRHSCP